MNMIRKTYFTQPKETLSHDAEVIEEAMDNMWNGRGKPFYKEREKKQPLLITDEILYKQEEDRGRRK